MLSLCIVCQKIYLRNTHQMGQALSLSLYTQVLKQNESMGIPMPAVDVTITGHGYTHAPQQGKYRVHPSSKVLKDN